MPNQNYKQQLRKVAGHLHDPFRFRVFVTGVVLGVAYFAFYSPLSGKIEETTHKLSKEQHLETLCQDVELLRSQMKLFEHRLVKDSDANEWIEYVFNGVRALPLQLLDLDLRDERKVKLYRAIGLRLRVRGEMKHLDALLYWLETNDRLFRIDKMKLTPDRTREKYRVMQLELLGLKG